MTWKKLRKLGAFRSRSTAGSVVLACLLGAAAIWIVWPRRGSDPLITDLLSVARTAPTGEPRLVSIEPFAQPNGEQCEWVPASAKAGLAELLQQEAAGGESASERSSVPLERPALRAIRDPFPTYSAVAVDAKNNEIILQDENLYQIMVYDRLANTPPNAAMTEPKRVIGGPQTKVEFNCSLYIDPKTSDIYSVANDTIRTISVFSHNAKGNVQPERFFRTPIRAYGIAVDEENREVFVTVQAPASVLIYPKYAKGDEKPVRVLRGNQTGLGDPHGIGLDTKKGWMFVANYGSAADYVDGGGNTVPASRGAMVPGSGRFELPSVTVYPLKAGENTAPLRAIQGANTQLNWPGHIFVDQDHGEVYVANDGNDSIVVFRETDSGDVAPTRVLRGPKTQLKNPTDVFVDTINDEIVVANMGNHRATVYPRTAQGNAPPIRVIRAAASGMPALQIANPGSVAYDTKRDEILVPN